MQKTTGAVETTDADLVCDWRQNRMTAAPLSRTATQLLILRGNFRGLGRAATVLQAVDDAASLCRPDACDPVYGQVAWARWDTVRYGNPAAARELAGAAPEARPAAAVHSEGMTSFHRSGQITSRSPHA